ncbi:MAG: DUF4340 domain-containing protein [SAR324 cluster bacterium]|nr:DUF4340 domain-containing protein [SAR324 cluster bacterium]
MANKKLLFATLGLVVLAVLSQLMTSQKTIKEQNFPPLLDSSVINRVDSIQIKKGDFDLNFKLADGKWVLPEKNGFPAKKAKILALLTHLVRTKPSTLVTEDKSRLDDFDLGKTQNEHSEHSESGNSLILRSGEKVLFTLDVGRARESVRKQTGGVYISLNKSGKVYLLKEALQLPYMPEDWLDTQIVAFKKAEIQGFFISHGTQEIELARKSEAHPFSFKKKAKSKPLTVGMEDLFREVEDMVLMDIVTHTKSEALKLKVKAKVVITLFSGVALAFEILEEDLAEERNHYLRLLPPPNKASALAYADLFKLSEKWIFQIQEWQATKWTYAHENLVPGVR